MTLLDTPVPNPLHVPSTSSSPTATASLPDVIEPRWWTGTPWLAADTYRIDCADLAMDDGDLSPDGELGRRVRATYDAIGLVLLANTGLTELAAMRRVAMLVLGDEMNYAGGANPRRRLEPNVYEVGAPLSAWLHYHHEMAYVGRSTAAIGFLCKHALPTGRGRTFVADNIAATDALLATDFGRRLRDKGLCYHRNLTDRDAYAGRVEYGVYNHWQRSFDTDVPEVAVSRARAAGLQTEWGPDGLLRTRYYADAFEWFPALDRNLLYASVADHGVWFDTWPLVQHLPYADRPLDLTFGDGTPFTRDELQVFVDVYDRFGTPIDWSVGDVAVICNYRFAHGRPGIHLCDDEQRELGVVLGPEFERVGVLPHAW
jgi:hypothetical protein